MRLGHENFETSVFLEINLPLILAKPFKKAVLLIYSILVGTGGERSVWLLYSHISTVVTAFFVNALLE